MRHAPDRAAGLAQASDRHAPPLSAAGKAPRGTARAVALLALALFVALVSGGGNITAAPQPPAPLPTKDVLERQKLKAEIAKLEDDAEAAEGFSGAFARYAPVVTALLALGGLLVAIGGHLLTRRTELEQRRLEGVHRLEDRFATILTDLGSTEVPTQAGAAASLVTYLQPEHARFHHQVRVAVLTNLKVDHVEPIRKLLARVYKEACAAGDPADRFERDLSRAKLSNTDLSGLELREADLAFAELNNATLVGCNLYRARGLRVELIGARACTTEHHVTDLIEVRFKDAVARDADFTRARMVNAHFEGADLRGARFRGALMQAAHLEETDLRGAQFAQANVDDTYFYGAQLDGTALVSLIRAYNWRNAHFDLAVEERLEAIAGQQP